MSVQYTNLSAGKNNLAMPADTPIAKRQKLSSATKVEPTSVGASDCTQTVAHETTAEDNADEDDESGLTSPDSHISTEAALVYWSSTPATVSGVLGGYPGLSRADVQGSANFLTLVRRCVTPPDGYPKRTEKLRRVVDCGAGIGRVSVGFLAKVAKRVDVVEPVRSFVDEVRREGREGGLKGRLGTVWMCGLQDWLGYDQDGGQPGLGDQTVAVPAGSEEGGTEDTASSVADTQKYDLIWNQWCLGQLTDKQLTTYLSRSKPWLTDGGFICVKENLSNHPLGQDIFDETDSSVTRTQTKFEKIFAGAGLRIVRTELQRGFPRELYPVRSWALQPR